MAFSWGAAAGGAEQTLEKILTERRQAALLAQQQAQQAAEQEFRERQLAQQLQIEQMRDARARDQAKATAAGQQLAAIRTNYTNIGKQVVEQFGPGELVPRDVANTVMGAYGALKKDGEIPVPPPITESAIPVQQLVTPMTTGAIAPLPTPGEAVAGGTAMAPMPQPERVKLPTVPLTRVSAGVMAEPMYTRTPTAEERETKRIDTAAKQVYEQANQAKTTQPEKTIENLEQLVITVGQNDPAVLKTVQPVINSLIANAQKQIDDSRAAANIRSQQADAIQADEMMSRLSPDEKDVVRFAVVKTKTPPSGRDGMRFMLASAGGTPQFGDQVASLLLTADKATAERINARENMLRQYDMLRAVIAGTPENQQNLVAGTLGQMARTLGASAPDNVFDQLSRLVTNAYMLEQTGKAATQQEYERTKQLIPNSKNAKDLNLDKIGQIMKIAIDANNADWATVSGGMKNAETIGRLRTYVPPRAMSGTVTNVQPPQKSGTGANVQSSQKR